MSIPENQLETWSHQGSVTQSASTYATIKRALEDSNVRYVDRNFSIFLQGSYGNDTNIYAESDVDIVIRYEGAFFHDFTDLALEQKSAFHSSFPDSATYPYESFKNHVREALESAFGNSVVPAKKAFKITPNNSRRSADVVVAFQYRRYFEFKGNNSQRYSTGMCFFTSDNTRIANYPEYHSANLTRKHQATNGSFKPLVRIFKNMRSKLVENRAISKDTAPSYFIEGLLYNVPNSKFSGSYENMVFNALQWLQQTADRSEFLCANEEYYLLRDNSNVCWPCAHGEQFINAAIGLWNEW